MVDAGWTLRGGSDPDAAALANILANAGVVGPEGPLSEELIFLVAGGLGAGYILWEFQHDDSRVVTLGFTNSAQYLRPAAVGGDQPARVQADWSRTSGAVGAAAELRRELGAGQPVVVWPDRYLIGYWQLPAWLDGHGGHPVIAYAERDGRIHLDDRTLAPLTVAGEDVDRARARVGSYRNAMLAVRTRDCAIPERPAESCGPLRPGGHGRPPRRPVGLLRRPGLAEVGADVGGVRARQGVAASVRRRRRPVRSAVERVGGCRARRDDRWQPAPRVRGRD